MSIMDLIQSATNAANQYGVPPELYRAVIQQESGWNEYAIGTHGEYGLAQLMPGTAQDLGIDQYSTQDNLNGGAKYLSQLFSQFGNWKDALRAYNTGPAKAAADPTAGKSYSDTVLSNVPTLTANTTASDILKAINPLDPNSAINNVPSAYNPAAWAGKAFWDWVIGPGLKYVGGMFAVLALIWFGMRSLLPEGTQNTFNNIARGAASLAA